MAAVNVETGSCIARTSLWAIDGVVLQWAVMMSLPPPCNLSREEGDLTLVLLHFNMQVDQFDANACYSSVMTQTQVTYRLPPDCIEIDMIDMVANLLC